MKECQNCGQQLADQAVICPKCGCSAQPMNYSGQQVSGEDKVDVGLVILSVLIPLFGIIYWLVEKNNRPKCAPACAKAAIISWVVMFVLIILIGVLSGFVLSEFLLII